MRGWLIALAGVLVLGFQIAARPQPVAESETGPAKPIKLRARKLAGGIDAASAGLVTADIDGDGNPELIVWSNRGIEVFRNGSPSPVNCGLGGIMDVISISPGDFDNDGLTDLAILTKSGAELWVNRKGRFEKANVIVPEGAYNKAVWIDYDHDNDLDLFLLGDKSTLLRNDGTGGFTDVHNNFPFVAGRAVDGALLDLNPDTDGMDLAVVYSDRPGVLYADQLHGRYEAQDLNVIPAGVQSIAAADLDNDGATDLVVGMAAGAFPIFNRRGSFEKGAQLSGASSTSASALAIVDLENHGFEDIAVPGAVFRNEGLARFTKIKLAGEDGPARTAVDFDGDGRTDLIEVQGDGSLLFLRNEAEVANGWLRATLTGVKNLRTAYGSRIELRAGAHYQKRTYFGQPLVFGMRGYKEGTVRIIWPNGLIQNEIHQAAGTTLTYKETPRR